MRRWRYKFFRDESLMHCYASGDSLAFEVLYLRHKTALLSFLRRQCSDQPVVEELAQEAWMAVVKQAESYQPTAKFKTWLFRIAHNRLIDHWRKRSHSNKYLSSELSKELATSFELQDDPLISQLAFQQLLESLEILSGEQLETLLLKIEGFSYAEIAEITNAKQETVKSRLRYATRHLRLAQEASA